MPMAGRRHSPLPYDVIAGVEPCPGGWLMVRARLLTTMIALEVPQVVPTLIDVLDYRPTFSLIALHSHLGLLEKGQTGGRQCDREARRVLGGRRSGAIVSAPSRLALAEPGAEPMSGVARSLLTRVREVSEQMQPYWQRTVYEVNPELGFHQLNGDTALRYGKRTVRGRAERRALLQARFPDLAIVTDTKVPGASIQHLLDATMNVWTARRVAARAVIRLPADGVWDEQGLRMEIVR